MSALTTTILAVLDNPPADVDPTTGKGPEWGKAAPVGLLVILLLAIATFFLLRSMTRNLKKVPDSFDQAVADPVGPGQPAGGVGDELGDGVASARLAGPGTEPGPTGLVDDRAT